MGGSRTSPSSWSPSSSRGSLYGHARGRRNRSTFVWADAWAASGRAAEPGSEMGCCRGIVVFSSGMRPGSDAGVLAFLARRHGLATDSARRSLSSAVHRRDRARNSDALAASVRATIIFAALWALSIAVSITSITLSQWAPGVLGIFPLPSRRWRRPVEILAACYSRHDLALSTRQLGLRRARIRGRSAPFIGVRLSLERRH